MSDNKTLPSASSISEKVALAELRARDSKARREILENEIAILKLKRELSSLTGGTEGNT